MFKNTNLCEPKIPPHCEFSIIMPVHDGEATLSRAIDSIHAQTNANWELLTVDDCSTDQSDEILRDLARTDPRIRTWRMQQNVGPSAARNFALAHARGLWVTYLDCDDEYYDDFLANVAKWRQKSDVLVFAYDYVYDFRPPKGEPPNGTWDCSTLSSLLFATNLTTPLGVAHSRDLIVQAGGFDQELWCLEDWELWKRFARAGAEFIYLPLKSGLYHIRERSRSRAPTCTDRQFQTYCANMRRSQTIYSGGPRTIANSKLAYASLASIIDPMAVQASSVAEALKLLGQSGFNCQAFCTTKVDAGTNSTFDATLSDLGIPHRIQDSFVHGHPARFIFALHKGTPVTLLRTPSTSQEICQQEFDLFMQSYQIFLQKIRPDALLTFGNGQVGEVIVNVAKQWDIPVIFWLDAPSYLDIDTLLNTDYVIVQSEFSRQYLYDRYGLVCQVLPPVIDWELVRAERRTISSCVVLADHRHLQCGQMNVRIADELIRRRPDIPLRVVERVGEGFWLECGGPNYRVNGTPTKSKALIPRDLYGETRIIVIPGLARESPGRIAAEAMINGITVVASDRGAMAETIDDAGFVVHMPELYTPEGDQGPGSEIIGSWVDIIAYLWDEPRIMDHICEKALQRSQLWHPTRVGPLYADFFRQIKRQPGPPLVPGRTTPIEAKA